MSVIIVVVPVQRLCECVARVPIHEPPADALRYQQNGCYRLMLLLQVHVCEKVHG
jgi:hypothetical protein